MKTSKVFDALGYSALQWPGKVTRLVADSLGDYQQRAVSPASSIAELYHINSRLYPSKAATLLASRTDTQTFRRQCMQRTAASIASRSDSESTVVPEWLPLLLEQSTSSFDLDAFYAVELRVRVGGRLFSWEPIQRRLIALKDLETSDSSRIDAAKGVLRRHAPCIGSEVATLFVLGWFARNDLLFGPRGYRRTLLDAGRVLEALLRGCASLAIGTEVCTEFTDVDVDRAIEADGVEVGTLAVIDCGTANEGR